MTGLAGLRELGSDVVWHAPAEGLGLLEIPLVTGNTGGRKPLKLADRRTLMAIVALRGRVGSEQRETILVFLHLLHGNLPSLHRVTLSTVRAHLSLVHVGMTVLAIFPDVRENRLHVALRALHFFMHAAQRIPGLVVLEFRVRLDRAPRGHPVAVFARDGERRPVRIPRSRPVLLMGRLCRLGRPRIRWRRASHTGEGEQTPQNELEHCKRESPF